MPGRTWQRVRLYYSVASFAILQIAPQRPAQARSGIGKLKLIAACVRWWANHLLCAEAPREHVRIVGEFAVRVCLIRTAAYVIMAYYTPKRHLN
jgi:hypothetical protein